MRVSRPTVNVLQFTYKTMKEDVFIEQPIALQEIVDCVTTSFQPRQIHGLHLGEDAVKNLGRKTQQFNSHDANADTNRNSLDAGEIDLYCTWEKTGKVGHDER